MTGGQAVDQKEGAKHQVVQQQQPHTLPTKSPRAADFGWSERVEIGDPAFGRAILDLNALVLPFLVYP